MSSTNCFLGLVLLLLISEHLAKEAKVKCISKKKQKIRMTCRKGGVIYKPNVVESSGSCTKPQCQGLSADTIGKRNQCYWERKCELRMQALPMVTRCHTFATTLTVKEGYCVRKAKIKDICKTGRFGALDEGPIIVRSHRKYPWDYNHDNFRNKFNTAECQIRYSVKSEAVGNSVLAYSIDDIDIDSDNDDLRFMHDKSVYNLTNDSKKNNKLDIDRNADIVLSFRTNGSAPGNMDIYGPNATKGGRGFILCLQVMTKQRYDKDYGGSKSVCDKVIQKTMKIKVPGKKGPGKKGRKKGKKNKKKG